MRSFADLDEAVEAVVITVLEYSRYYWDIIEKLKLPRDSLKKELAAYVKEHRTTDGFFKDKRFNPSTSRSSNPKSSNSKSPNSKSSNNSTQDKFEGWQVNLYTIPVYGKARDYMPKLD